MVNHELKKADGILILNPESPLESTDFVRLAQEIDPYIEANGKLHGVMIDAQSFPGWKDSAALIAHLKFIKNHHQKIQKLAIVSDSSVLTVAPKIASHFIQAEVKHFAGSQREQALDWLKAATRSAPRDQSWQTHPVHRISASSPRCAAVSWMSGSTSTCRRSTPCFAPETKGRSLSRCCAQRDRIMSAGSPLRPTQGLARGMAVERYWRAARSASRQSNSLAHVRRLRQHHRPRRGPVRCRSGARCIAPRRPWRGVPPGRRSLKQASRSSMCSCRSSAAARPGSSAARASAKPCCSPK